MFKLLNYKFFSLILLIAVGWFGVSAVNVAARKKNVQNEGQDLQQRISALERENQFLGRSEEYFKSDAFLEHQARVKLNYKFPEEHVVFVYDKTASAQARTLKEEIRSMENYKKWWYYL